MEKKKRTWQGGVIILILASLTMTGVYFMNKNSIDSVSSNYIPTLQMKGYTDVKYAGFDFFGPFTSVRIPKGTGIGFAVYTGVKDSSTFRIFVKPIGESDIIVAKTEKIK
jgi:hypothetical protein